MDFNRVTKIILTKTGAEPITVTQGIEAGSISISEILFDGSLEFGAINSNKLELRLYSTVDIKGYKIQLLQGSSFVKDSQGNDTQELVNEQKMFTGYVQSCKLSGYDYYRDIIAYDELYFKKDLNIANFYSGTISQDVQNRYISFFDNDTDYPDKTLKAFREALCGDFLEFTLVDAPTLPNDPMNVEKTVSISSMKFSEMIKMICELQGTIPNMTRDGKLEFVTLKGAFGSNAVKTIYAFGENNALETENSTFEDYSVNKVTQVVLMGEDSDGNQQIAGYSTDESVSDNNNIVTFENNILILNKTADDTKGRNNNTNRIAQAIYANIKNVTYAPCELTFIQSDTSLKLGDLLVVRRQPLDVSGSSNIGKYVYCTSIELSGSQLVNQTVTCSGEESLSDSTSSSNPEFEALADKAYPIQTSMSVDYFRAKYISTDYIQAKMASFGEAVIGRLTADFVKTETLEANYATINRLNADIADVTSLFASYTKTVDLEAQYAKISTLDTTYLKANMANLGQVGMENFFAKAGIVDELQVGDGYVTGRLVGVKINADVIDTGTLAVERLIIKGNKTDVYTFQPSQPTGWSTSYNTYYRVSGFTSLGNIPKFKPNTYYYKDSNTYYLIQEEPSDWERHPSVYYKASTYTQNSTSTWRTLTNETKTWGTAPNQVRRKVYYNNSNTFIFKKSIGYNDSSILYKLNEGSGEVEGRTLTDDELNTQLNGQIIIAESITATQIHAKAITSNKIDSKAIKSDHIDVGQIEAVHISSGAITADKIKAGSITTECLAVGDFTNYFIVNPTNLNEFKWETSPSTFTEVGWITPTNNANYYALTEVLQLPAGTKLQLFGYIYTYAYSTGIVIRWIKSDGTVIKSDYASSGVSGESSIYYNTEATREFNNTNKNNLIKIPDYPTNAVSFQIVVYTKKSDMPKFHLRNFAIRRADGGDIIAGKIMSRNGNSYFNLDSGKIQTNNIQITGGQIQIGERSDGRYTQIKNGTISLFTYNPKINSAVKAFDISSSYLFDYEQDKFIRNYAAFILPHTDIGGFYFAKYSDISETTGINSFIEFDQSGYITTNAQMNDTGLALRHYRGYADELQLSIGTIRSGTYGICLDLRERSQTTEAHQSVAKLDIFQCFQDTIALRATVSESPGGTTHSGCIFINGYDIYFTKTYNEYSSNNSLDVYGHNFYSNNTYIGSSETIKTNITPSTSVLQSVFETSEIYSYNYTHQEPVVTLDGQEVFELDENNEPILDENGDPVPEMQTVADNETSYGFVIGDNYNTPSEVISEDGKHINLYSMASLTWKAVQELYERVKLLEGNTTQSV